MKDQRITLAALLALALLSACGPSEPPAAQSSSTDGADGAAPSGAATAGREIEPGLTMRILTPGSGATAAAGDTAVVHYTGWLYDEAAPDNRGKMFDSSLNRGQHFSFPLGAGRVIPGWDRGVVGMRVGEVRELTIAPELAYGQRGAGNLIPPGATLVFEVELADIEGRPAGTDGQ